MAIDRGEIFPAKNFELTCAKPSRPPAHQAAALVDQRRPSAWPHARGSTVRRYHYQTHAQLRRHSANFVSGYNCARRLKTLEGLTPYEYTWKIGTREPQRQPASWQLETIRGRMVRPCCLQLPALKGVPSLWLPRHLLSTLALRPERGSRALTCCARWR